MSRTSFLSVVLALLAVSAGARAQHVPGRVTAAPDPSTPLEQRWDWALANGPASGFWVGWMVDAGQGMRRMTSVESSTDRERGEAPNAPTLATVLAPFGGMNADVAVLFWVPRPRASGTPTSAGVRSAEARLDLRGEPMIWLGFAPARQSLPLLQALFAEAGEPVRREIAAAIALHAELDAVIPALSALPAGRDDARIRAEAVQWLGRAHPEGEAAEALTRIAFADPAELVRMEAVDALRRHGSDAAREALERIAASHPSRAARSEAAQALAEDP